MCLKALIKKLEQTKTIVIIKNFSKSFLVKVITVNKIEALSRSIQVKKTEISKWSVKLLANEEGLLIMTTTKGVISHLEAIQLNVGGEILGLVHQCTSDTH